MKNVKVEVDSLILEYDLMDLPSAQHKAGLAGLVLMINTMKGRKKTHVPELLKLTSSQARFGFTKQNFQALFDDLYDMTIVEIESRRRWQNKDALRVEEKTEKPADAQSKKIKIYVYEEIRPKGEFLKVLFPDGDGVWLDLWRSMLWETLRGIPRTRLIYEQRKDVTNCSMASQMWEGLIKSVELRKKGVAESEGLSSSLYIGAQGVNPEKVPFSGAIEQNLLLHFWTLVSLVFVPREITVGRDKEAVSNKNQKQPSVAYPQKRLSCKYSEKGYVLAIPEPASLDEFVYEITSLLKSLDTKPDGYRPRSALIDIPGEGGLEYLHHLVQQTVTKKEISFSLSAVELYQMEKSGNTIRTLHAERILPNESLLDKYNLMRNSCLNPLFKAHRIKNLLDGNNWGMNVTNLFSRYPWEFFIYSSGKTPSQVHFFGHDVKRKFSAIKNNLSKLGGDHIMSVEYHDDQLARLIYELTRAYVNQKAENKSGIKFEDFKKNKGPKDQIEFPKEYVEARQKVCADAFLAMRSRRETDFVDYFVGSLCSVPQFLPQGQYLQVSQALMTNWEVVKNLSMLALSAHSHLQVSKVDKGGKQ